MSKKSADEHVMDRLHRVAKDRIGGDPKSSYTARLFTKGTAKIAQKLGEEAVETVIEAVGGDNEALVQESADLLYHLVVLWADRGVRPSDVWSALAEREGTSGLSEKASRRTGS